MNHEVVNKFLFIQRYSIPLRIRSLQVLRLMICFTPFIQIFFQYFDFILILIQFLLQMDQNPNFEQDLIESEQAFIEQFDRNSANFHNGNPTVVPVGGQRVPDSMPTMYPQQVIENASQNVRIYNII
ncbi:hypothetical protein FGO68_gene4121 [Halteria grandinella]|uniref:Uncharacterized protein n=1 Tax=Halteria grandinella TaxID=5974 RepID=A0A8J8SY47_HALGN|nr:hypothetical protein FGO68_gene4121 [Halteria grandinella]